MSGIDIMIDGEYVVSKGELNPDLVPDINVKKVSEENKELRTKLREIDQAIGRALSANDMPCSLDDRVDCIDRLGSCVVYLNAKDELFNKKKGTIVTMLHDLINAIEDSGCDTGCTIDDQY